MKDVICKEYRYSEIIPYQLKILGMGKVKFFIPITFECVDKDYIKLCYNLSDMDPLGYDIPGDEAPYIAYGMITGMTEAMDYYIFPSQYMLRKKLVYKCRNNDYRIAFVPEIFGEMPLKDPGKTIRKMVLSLIRETYNVEAKGRKNQKWNIENGDIVLELLDILSDNTIGMDSCLRRIDNLKEKDLEAGLLDKETHRFSKPLSMLGRLDLSRKFI